MQLELHHFKVESRLISIILAVVLLFNMLDPAMLILNVEHSMVYRVATLSRQPGLIAACMFAMCACLLPYAVLQVFSPEHRMKRPVTQAAVLGLCGGGIAWLYMSYLSRNLDFETITGIFMRNGAVQIVFGFALALGLNYQQQRRAIEAAE